MMKYYINQIIIPFVIAIILVIVGFNIKRNRGDFFYLEFSQFNLGISVFVSLAVLLFGTARGKHVLIIVLGFILFMFINSLFTSYRIESDTLIVKKNILTDNLYIDIKQIESIDSTVDLLTESLSYKITLADSKSFLIERDIEDINSFFSSIKGVNDKIILPNLVPENKFLVLNSIRNILLPIIFYTIGFRYLIKNILNL